MTTTCSRVATLTTTEVSSVGTAITTFTEVLTTLPDSFITTQVATTTCFSISIGTDCSSTSSEVVITVPGAETLVQIPLTIIADGLTTVTNTLFDTVCSTISKPAAGNPATPPIVQPGTISVSTTPSPRSPIISGPSATPSASASIAADSTQSTGTSEKKSFALGPVIGGAVGGVVVVAALLWLGWKFFLKPSAKGGKASKHDSLWEKEEACTDSNNCPPPTQNLFCEPQAPAEPQSSTANSNSTGPEQQQQQQQDDEWHKPHRLPKKAEEKLKEKIDKFLHKPTSGGKTSAATGTASAHTTPLTPASLPPSTSLHTSNQPHFSGSSSAAHSPLTSPPPGNFGYPDQQHFVANTGAGSPAYNNQAHPQRWNSSGLPPTSDRRHSWNAPPSASGYATGQYHNVAAPGETTYTQQPVYAPQLNVSHYRGYAEPSDSEGGTDRPLSQ